MGRGSVEALPCWELAVRAGSARSCLQTHQRGAALGFGQCAPFAWCRNHHQCDGLTAGMETASNELVEHVPL